MRITLAALAVAGALAAAPAIAADKAEPAPALPEILPPSVAPSCYAQALAGGSVIASKPDGAVLPASLSTQSWSAAAGLGCDVKMERLVIGALARLEAPVETSGALIKADRSWMIAGRVGYLINTGVMPYALVGYESSDWELAGVSLSRDGLTVGGGLEVMLTKQLSLTAEYTYSGLGKTDVLGPTVDTDQHKARLGLSFRFGSLFGD